MLATFVRLDGRFVSEYVFCPQASTVPLERMANVAVEQAAIATMFVALAGTFVKTDERPQATTVPFERNATL
jgi:hypothetical protein